MLQRPMSAEPQPTSPSLANAQRPAEDAARYVELLIAHQRKLYAYISTLLMGDGAASDVLQDTNVDLWARFEDFDFDRPFLPWAFGFARQRVRAFRKSQSRSRLLVSEAAMALIENETAELAEETDQRLAALRRCVQNLTDRQTALIVNRYHEKSSVKLIAARLGTTAHNVASQLYRIRQALAKCIDARLAAEKLS